MSFLKPTTFSSVSTLSSHPLFSTVVTFYTLILLYIPSLFLEIIFSPVILLTGIILLTLLRLGAIQKNQTLPNTVDIEIPQKEIISNSIELPTQTSPSPSPSPAPAEDQTQTWAACQKMLFELERETDSGPGMDPSPAPFFYTWDVRAPLDVIYEEYEGEEDEVEEEQNDNVCMEKCGAGIERYPSLSMYFPETDSDSSSEIDFPVIGEWKWPERMTCFRWEYEEEKDGLIEIALDVTTSRDVFLAGEEDSLIEIDLFPARG